MLWACRRTPPGGLPQQELAAAMAVSAAQVSVLVEQLRRQGLLQGRRAQNDRRRQLWRLTPAGRARLQDVLADLSDWARAAADRLGADGPQALGRLLDGLIDSFGSRPGDHDSTSWPSSPPDGESARGCAAGKPNCKGVA